MGRLHYTGLKEIADAIGVTVRTVQRWRKTRGLPIRYAGGVAVLVEAEYLCWLKGEENGKKGK